MSVHCDVEFRYRGHLVQVTHIRAYAEWLGELDTNFTVLIDGNSVAVPGIWKAYKAHGEKGVTLVIQAYLDVSPMLVS